MENDSRKNNVVILTSKESLDKCMMASADYYHLLWKKGRKNIQLGLEGFNLHKSWLMSLMIFEGLTQHFLTTL